MSLKYLCACAEHWNFSVCVFIWLCWVFVPAWAFSSCGSRGLLSSCGAQASHCSTFSCCRALADSGHTGFISWGSRALERGFSSCGVWAYLLRGRWDLPRSGIEPVSPALCRWILYHWATREIHNRENLKKKKLDHSQRPAKPYWSLSPQKTNQWWSILSLTFYYLVHCGFFFFFGINLYFFKSCIKIVSILIPEFFGTLLNLVPEARVMPTSPWASPE